MSTISSNTKIKTQQLDKVSKLIEENINRIERLEKQNNDFSESLNTFQPMQDDKVGQVKKKAENLQVLLKSVNKDIEYKH